jgi:hypothetical protein
VIVIVCLGLCGHRRHIFQSQKYIRFGSSLGANISQRVQQASYAAVSVYRSRSAVNVHTAVSQHVQQSVSERSSKLKVGWLILLSVISLKVKCCIRVRCLILLSGISLVVCIRRRVQCGTNNINASRMAHSTFRNVAESRIRHPTSSNIDGRTHSARNAARYQQYH